jgi:hypothetical protein
VFLEGGCNRGDDIGDTAQVAQVEKKAETNPIDLAYQGETPLYMGCKSIIPNYNGGANKKPGSSVFCPVVTYIEGVLASPRAAGQGITPHCRV